MHKSEICLFRYSVIPYSAFYKFPSEYVSLTCYLHIKQLIHYFTDTVWLEIFEAKKVRCFCGFRVNLNFFILEIKYKSTLIACNLCDNF